LPAASSPHKAQTAPGSKRPPRTEAKSLSDFLGPVTFNSDVTFPPSVLGVSILLLIFVRHRSTKVKTPSLGRSLNRAHLQAGLGECADASGGGQIDDGAPQSPCPRPQWKPAARLRTIGKWGLVGACLAVTNRRTGRPS